MSADGRPDDSGSPRRQEPDAEDVPLRALDELVQVAEVMTRTMAALAARAEVIRQGRANGLSYREIVGTGEPPLIAGSLTPSIEQPAGGGASAAGRGDDHGADRRGLRPEPAAHLGAARVSAGRAAGAGRVGSRPPVPTASHPPATCGTDADRRRPRGRPARLLQALRGVAEDLTVAPQRPPTPRPPRARSTPWRPGCQARQEMHKYIELRDLPVPVLHGRPSRQQQKAAKAAAKGAGTCAPRAASMKAVIRTNRIAASQFPVMAIHTALAGS